MHTVSCSVCAPRYWSVHAVFWDLMSQQRDSGFVFNYQNGKNLAIVCHCRTHEQGLPYSYQYWMDGGWGTLNLSLGRPDTMRWHTTSILLENYLANTVQNKHNKEVHAKKLIGVSLSELTIVEVSYVGLVYGQLWKILTISVFELLLTFMLWQY